VTRPLRARHVLAYLAGICHHTRVITWRARYLWLLALIILVIALPLGWGVGLAVAAAVAYYFSLHLHPDEACRTCGGTGRHPGSLFLWSRRQCSSCAGQGRHRRLGNVFLHPNQDVLRERSANKAKKRRKLPRV
jgi:hypothetical protein